MKALGFDGWTTGSHHFVRLIPALARRGVDLSLTHLGSWGNDPGRPPQERIGALPVRDISSYRGGSLRAVLDEEQPDVVIFLSTTTFAHRAFMRYCRSRAIPTLNLYHGMTTTWFDPKTAQGIRSSRLGHARFVGKRLLKTMRHTVPCYVGALVRTGARASGWARFARDVFVMFAGQHIPVAAEDSRADACAVYTESEVEHAMFTYGFAKGDVHVVGNPDLPRFGLSQGLIGSRIDCPPSASRDIMYIDTGLAPAGLMFSSRGEFLKHLRETNDSLRRQRWQMLLKLHPAQDHDAIEKALASDGIRVVGNQEFLERLRGCAATIVENTSLAMVPALMGMPLLFARYGVLSNLAYGSGLTSYPNGKFLTDVDSCSDLLVSMSAAPEVVRAWISANAGPLPAEEMPARVADIVCALIDTAHRRHSAVAGVGT